MANLIQILKTGVLNTPEVRDFDKLENAVGAVALILRESDPKSSPQQAMILKKTFQLLILRRNPSPKDMYSGHLCFPGGGIKEGQSLLEAAMRQTYEQAGIALKKQNLITQINRCFLAFHPTKSSQISILVFQVPSQTKVEVDTKEISEFKWVSLDSFLDPQFNSNSFSQKYKNYPMSFILKKPKEQIKEINKNFVSIDVPYFDVGFSVPLQGFTMYTTLYIVGKIYFYALNRQECHKNKAQIEKLQSFLNRACSHKIIFREDYPRKKEAESEITNHWLSYLTTQIELKPHL